MSVKKILSIDFDVIMYPCIKIYNDYSSSTENATFLWNKYKDRFFSGSTQIIYDANTLVNIATLIKNAVNNGAKLIPIVNHSEIVDYLKKDINFNENTYDLINIDYHHDVWYNENDRNDASLFDSYYVGNWIGYLHSSDKLNSVTWVKPMNSTMPVDFKFTKIMRLDEMPDLFEEQYDEIYFSLSPQWVPYEFKHLYDLIIQMTK